ncbi:hypothetical protein H5410_028701 [Solanum commersonii]|uniref:Uncharacterized protein n=1 Tax=Solanum commersonii TaxID=4109 RepID=A0A9J5Z2V1_SOLCO|nr:hypothetical protein H5410_028701 [Solanum commersonii]
MLFSATNTTAYELELKFYKGQTDALKLQDGPNHKGLLYTGLPCTFARGCFRGLNPCSWSHGNNFTSYTKGRGPLYCLRGFTSRGLDQRSRHLESNHSEGREEAGKVEEEDSSKYTTFDPLAFLKSPSNIGENHIFQDTAHQLNMIISNGGFSNSSLTPGNFLAAPKYLYPGPRPPGFGTSTIFPSKSVIFAEYLVSQSVFPKSFILNLSYFSTDFSHDLLPPFIRFS